MAVAQPNYFALLGVDESFLLDEADLRKRYLAAQRESHPDRLIGKSEQERTVAVQRSMDVTQAYETLKSPLLRAQHLLDLQGIKINTDGRDNVKPAPELLMEMMELREQLAEADSEAMAAKAVQDLKTAMTRVIGQMQAAFTEKDWSQAAQLTMRLRYYGKALEEALARQYHWKLAHGQD